MKIGTIKADTPKSQPHDILEVGKTTKSVIRVEITSTYKYNTRSSTKRVNHVTNFKNAPKMFPLEATEKIRLHIVSGYHACMEPQKERTTVEPI